MASIDGSDVAMSESPGDATGHSDLPASNEEILAATAGDLVMQKNDQPVEFSPTAVPPQSLHATSHSGTHSPLPPAEGTVEARMESPRADETSKSDDLKLKSYEAREILLLGKLGHLERDLNNTKLVVDDWRSLHHCYEVQTPSKATAGGVTGQMALRYAMVDPLVNLEIKELRVKLWEREQEIKKLKDELQAANFSPDSIMGRRLISKCRTLQDENADLGKVLAERQLQPLQVQIGALQKQLNFYRNQMKSMQGMMADLDEENEGLTLQMRELTQRLQAAQKSSLESQREVHQLRQALDNAHANLERCRASAVRSDAPVKTSGTSSREGRSEKEKDGSKSSSRKDASRERERKSERTSRTGSGSEKRDRERSTSRDGRESRRDRRESKASSSRRKEGGSSKDATMQCRA